MASITSLYQRGRSRLTASGTGWVSYSCSQEGWIYYFGPVSSLGCGHHSSLIDARSLGHRNANYSCTVLFSSFDLKQPWLLGIVDRFIAGLLLAGSERLKQNRHDWSPATSAADVSILLCFVFIGPHTAGSLFLSPGEKRVPGGVNGTYFVSPRVSWCLVAAVEVSGAGDITIIIIAKDCEGNHQQR